MATIPGALILANLIAAEHIPHNAVLISLGSGGGSGPTTGKTEGQIWPRGNW